MRASLKLKWLTALLSGEYKQGQSQLKLLAERGSPEWGVPAKPDRFCCLGVLCDISGKGAWRGTRFVYKRKGQGGFVPKPLRAEIKLTEEQESQLAQMNDAGKSFDQIARWIAAHV